MRRLILAALCAVAALPGCKTLPTPNQQAAAAVIIDVAAGVAIQQGSPLPAVWKVRAAAFKSIATTMLAADQGGTVTLATLQADLQPLIAKLGPADVLAANALVTALGPVLQQQLGANPTVGATQQAVAMVLNDIIAACNAYGA